MLDFKYFAGFIDSDGSIQIHAKKFDEKFAIYPVVHLSQKRFRDFNLEELAKFYELSVSHPSRNDVSEIRISGTKGRRLLEAVKNHLVIKDDLASYILGLPQFVNEVELKSVKKVINNLRKKLEPTKQHPSRRWMAGYIDGDGSLQAYMTKSGSISPRLDISSWCEATAGQKLIMKAFGGYMVRSGNTASYRLSLSPTKVNELYEYIGQHLRIKKTQMELLRDYVGKNRHSKRNGATNETNIEFCKLLATTKSEELV